MLTQNIGTIAVTLNVARPGQSVLIDVRKPDGSSYDNTEPFHVEINGIPGSKQYLQFLRPGTHAIRVVAHGATGREEESTAVEVSGPRLVWNDVGTPIL